MPGTGFLSQTKSISTDLTSHVKTILRRPYSGKSATYPVSGFAICVGFRRQKTKD